MKILFIQPAADFMIRGTTYPVCRSMMVTASYFESLGNDVLVFDRCVDFRKPKKIIDSFSPELAMIYVPPTASLGDAIELSAYLKKKGAVVVWGEVVASALAEQSTGTGNADFVITGETEMKLKMLIEELHGNKNYENIPGLTYKKDNKVFTTPNDNMPNLDILPPINWDLIDVKKCFRRFHNCKRMLYMYTSRGCPFKCGFCYNTMFYNSEHRKRSISHVLSEIKYLEEKYKLDGVNFSDEMLWLTEEEIEQISKFRKENNLHFHWGGEVRADTYRDTDILNKMYQAGCRWLLIGIETGSETTRKQINKPMNQEMIRDFVNKCTDAGISTLGSFIIGFPDETPEQAKETAIYAKSLNLSVVLFDYYIAIPRTPLGDKLIAEGKLNINMLFSNMADSSSAAQQIQSLTKNHSEIPDKDLKVIKSYFDWQSFTNKQKGPTQNNFILAKALDTLIHFAEGNAKDAIMNVFHAGKTFLSVLFYSHAYPKIKKKYGLNK